jgi:hypothetical protein
MQAVLHHESADLVQLDHLPPLGGSDLRAQPKGVTTVAAVGGIMLLQGVDQIRRQQAALMRLMSRLGTAASAAAVRLSPLLPGGRIGGRRKRGVAGVALELALQLLDLLGQAHSHPGAHVQHSPLDDADTFSRFEGMISVVVPYFGRYGLQLHACGIHRYLHGRFWPISAEDVGRHLVVLPGERDFRGSLPESIPLAAGGHHAR